MSKVDCFVVTLMVAVSSFRLAYNVCVSAVVPYRSRVLSHGTNTLNEDKTLSQPVTAPLQKHAVGGSWASSLICQPFLYFVSVA
jgi:hypothetical protein